MPIRVLARIQDPIDILGAMGIAIAAVVGIKSLQGLEIFYTEKS